MFKRKNNMKILKFGLSLIITLFTLNSCDSPVEIIPAPTSGIIQISAQFADESVSIEQFTSNQMSPYGDTIRIQFPYYFPRGTETIIDISRMRMTAILPVNVKIRPSLTIMDLTKPNTIEVLNSDGTIDKHVIIGELVQ